MIDDHPDLGPDPLAGRDPHPREQIDLWPFHDARQELLEEIVSQPGPGNAAAPSTRRFLVPVGIAAAVALVAGGACFVAGDDDGDKSDDQVVASTDSPSTSDETGGADGATEATTTEGPSEEPTEPTEPARIPVSELKKGDMLSQQQCRQLGRGVIVYREGDKPRTTGRQARTYVVLADGKNNRLRWVRSVTAGKDRFIGVDKDCTVVSVGRRPGLRLQD